MLQRITAFLVLALGIQACAEERLNRVPQPPEQPPAEPKEFNPPKPELETPAVCDTGAVIGLLCQPGTDIPLAGANIGMWIRDCNGEDTFEQTVATSNGQFSLQNLPVGIWDLEIEHGTYTETMAVEVLAGEITILNGGSGDAVCVAPPDPKFAVVPGSYDRVQSVLDDLGLPYDVYDAQGAGNSQAYTLFTDLEALSEYDVIFVNCGSTTSRDIFAPRGDGTFDWDDPIWDTVRQFIAEGGSVYSSDWAWVFTEGIFPDAVDFHGNDNQFSAVTVGSTATINGRIQDEDVALFLGKDQVVLNYDLGGWAVIDDADVATNIQVRGDVSSYTSGALEDRPLIVRFQPFLGGGEVMYTTFHMEANITDDMEKLLQLNIIGL